MSLSTVSASALVGILCFSAFTSVASASSFPDVASTHPNAEAIEYVKAQGFVTGYADGTYRPNQTINRAEFTKIIIASRFSKEEIDGCLLHANVATLFRDLQKGAWYLGPICTAHLHKIIAGYPDGTFRPEAPINVVESAKILSQAFSLSSASVDASVWYKVYIDALASRNALPITLQGFDAPLTRGEMAEMTYRLRAQITGKPSGTFESLSSAKTARKHSPIVYRGSDYNGIETIFTLELPADWVGFGAQLGNPRAIAFIGDATKYGTRDGGAHMEVTRVLTNENSHGRQEGQSWFDFYIGADHPRFIVTKQEKRGGVQYYELTAKDQREFPFPYFFLFETDEALVGLAFKQNDITTQSVVASFEFDN